MKKNLLQRVCGCYEGSTWCKWGDFDHKQPVSHLKYRLLCFVERMADKPRVYRLRMADFLCRSAARLRHDKSYELFHAEGNRAASLAEDLTMTLVVGGYPISLDEPDADEMIHKIHELSTMAGATVWTR